LLDANIILITEILLMSAFLIMNASDLQLQAIGSASYHPTGNFLISSYIFPLLNGVSEQGLIGAERFTWWFHIIGVLAFLNYVPYSKHFHILLAFPNVYYSKLKPLTYISNMDSVSKEVKIAMGLIPENAADDAEPGSFGAKDVEHLSWKSLMDAYSCTECGRCTAVCPANLTGKKLSPRKIVMDTRDRLEEFGKLKRIKAEEPSIKPLLRNYISEEEIWACTTCNACSYECPVNIDPVSIIIELRRYVFMEESAAPSALNSMSSNIENNGAPWQYPAADRDIWTEELYFSK
jgi:heterodisulfide reductase subunit C